MYGDFSRNTFRPGKRYSAVLAQQGRVQLDADANEQAAIQLYQARTIAADLIGRHGGPAGAPGFTIEYVAGNRELDDLTIGGGRYYVDGILVDATRPAPGVPAERQDDGHGHDHAHDGDASEAATGSPADGTRWTYWEQPDAYLDPERAEDRLPDEFPYVVALKVWERTVTAAEDPEIREVALGAALPDTAARTKVIWQLETVTAGDLGISDNSSADEAVEAFDRWAERRTAPAGQLAARSERPAHADDDPCLVHPEARYRGQENQLYRVEIHVGGTAGEGATFKWSRENGSVVFPVAGFDGTWADLVSLGADDKLTLDVGDWVEVVDSGYANRGEPAPLLRVEEIDLPGRRVRLSGEPVPGVGRIPERHPFLRRWDHRGTGGRGTPKLAGGALTLKEGRWIDLEDGVQVWFAPGGDYRRGDHWLIPARTVTGTVEWPRSAAAEPLLQAPLGIAYHYAPLAWVSSEGTVEDLRNVFPALSSPVRRAAREG